MPAGTWLGGTQLVNPAFGQDGCVRTVIDVGAMHELLSGNLAYDYVGDRYHWALRWQNITATERNTILTRYRVKTAQSFSPPDEDVTTYTVLVMPGTYRESYTEGGGVIYYTCEMELQQTTTSEVA
jgi:hypothetical protein